MGGELASVNREIRRRLLRTFEIKMLATGGVSKSKEEITCGRGESGEGEDARDNAIINNERFSRACFT